MVTVHAAYVRKRNPRDMLGLWTSLCGSHNGPITTDRRRINCDECIRIASERGIVL